MRPSGALDRPLKIMLVAGEASGDALGAQLMRSLREKTFGTVTLIGVGGPAMRREGLQSIYSIADTSVIGLRDVAPRAIKILSRMRQVAEFAIAQRPDAVVLIDSTDFMRGIAARIKKRATHMRIIKYVSPQIWASRPGRAKALARLFDHILCLFPFEPQFYERVGLPATFVGNPVVERVAPAGAGQALRARLGVASSDKVIVMLPGSRFSEMRFMWPCFRDAVDRTIEVVGPAQILIPIVPVLEGAIRDASAAWDRKVVLLNNPEDRWGAFESASVALAKSGTVATELAMCGAPMVVGYKVGRLTAWAARRIMTVNYLNLLNLVLDRRAIPELLQEECTAENLAREMITLIKNPAARAAQLADAQLALKKLGMGGTSASARAAETILSLSISNPMSLASHLI